VRLLPPAEAWLDRQPEEITDVIEDWMVDRVTDGRPLDAVAIIEDYEYRSVIASAGVTVEYLALDHERRIFIERFL
jgi:hypothetical protein